jgi:hypothetical protein
LDASVLFFKFSHLKFIALLDLPAKLRVGGLRRDGYGVRRACFAVAAESLAPGEPATQRGITRCATLRSNRCRESETYARLDPRAAHALASRAGSRTHPPQAPGLDSRHSPPTRSFELHCWPATDGAPAWSLQRRAWPGRGASQAQAPAVDGLAAQRRYESAAGAYRATRTSSCSRHLFERSAAQRVMPRWAARPFSAGTPAAAAKQARTDAVAIAPRPGHARRCREVAELCCPEANKRVDTRSSSPRRRGAPWIPAFAGMTEPPC